MQGKLSGGAYGLVAAHALAGLDVLNLVGVRHHPQGAAFVALLATLLLFLLWNGRLLFEAIRGRWPAAVPAVLVDLLFQIGYPLLKQVDRG